MLQVNDGTIVIKGRKVDLLAEFAHLTHRLLEREIFTKEDVDMCIEVACMPQEEVERRTEEAERKIISAFLDELKHLKEFLDDLEKDVNKSE